jgi:hypothetical protein
VGEPWVPSRPKPLLYPLSYGGDAAKVSAAAITRSYSHARGVGGEESGESQSIRAR